MHDLILTALSYKNFKFHNNISRTFLICRAFMHFVLSKLIFYKFNKIYTDNCHVEIN